MHITLRQLQVFLAIVHEGSLAGAAETLHLTKPAVSMALRTLESGLGRPLFDRVRNRLRLNSNGQALLPMADEIITRAKSVEALFDSADLVSTLNIGASVTIGNHLLPKMLVQAKAQSLRLSASIRNTSALIDAIEHFELDFALVEGSVSSESVVVEPWGTDRMCVVAATDHPLASAELVTPQDLQGNDWILREFGSGSREQFDRLLAPELPSWRHCLTLETSEAIINAVRANLGLSLLSEIAIADAQAQGCLVKLPMQAFPERQLSLVYHRDKHMTPALQNALAFFRSWQVADES